MSNAQARPRQPSTRTSVKGCWLPCQPEQGGPSFSPWNSGSDLRTGPRPARNLPATEQFRNVPFRASVVNTNVASLSASTGDNDVKRRYQKVPAFSCFQCSVFRTHKTPRKTNCCQRVACAGKEDSGALMAMLNRNGKNTYA